MPSATDDTGDEKPPAAGGPKDKAPSKKPEPIPVQKKSALQIQTKKQGENIHMCEYVLKVLVGRETEPC